MGDVTFTGAGLAIITALLGVLATTITFLFKQLMAAQAARYDAVVATKDAALLALMASKDSAMQEMKTDRDNYRRMSLQATLVMQAKANKERQAAGLEPMPVLADVLPEHNSPITARQQDAADFATVRAAMVAAALELNVPVPEIEVVTAADTPELLGNGGTSLVEIHHAVVAGTVEITSPVSGESEEVQATITDAHITGMVVNDAEGKSPLSAASLVPPIMGEPNPKDQIVSAPADKPVKLS